MIFIRYNSPQLSFLSLHLARTRKSARSDRDSIGALRSPHIRRFSRISILSCAQVTRCSLPAQATRCSLPQANNKKKQNNKSNKMTLLQVTFQPFGILNALRQRFAIPLTLTCLLRVALFAPKKTVLYETIGRS